MLILDRYLLKNFLSTFFSVFVVLLLISFGTEATKILTIAISGQLPSSVVFQILLLKIIPSLEVIMPLVSLLSIIISMGRMYQDQEMVVLHSCGIGAGYFQKRIFIFLLPITILMLWINLFVIPWSFQTEKHIIQEAQKISPASSLASGRFNNLPNGIGVFYAKSFEEDGSFTQAWIKLIRNKKTIILVAPQGKLEWHDGKLLMFLFNGFSYEGLVNFVNTDSSDVVVQKFSRFEATLPQIQITSDDQSKWEQSIEFLWKSENTIHKGLLAWHSVMALSLIVLGLLGFKLSKTDPRKGRFAKLFVAIVLYIIYNQLLITERDYIKDGKIYWTIGMLPVPILFLVYAIYTPNLRRIRDFFVTKGIK